MNRLPGDEHVMAPNQKAEHGNGEAGEGNEAVAEDPLAGEACNQLAHDTHRRQNHNVNRRVRIKPEEMLKQQRISAQRRIENA